jgi:hypothetical protein
MILRGLAAAFRRQDWFTVLSIRRIKGIYPEIKGYAEASPHELQL